MGLEDVNKEKDTTHWVVHSIRQHGILPLLQVNNIWHTNEGTLRILLERLDVNQRDFPNKNTQTLRGAVHDILSSHQIQVIKPASRLHV